VIVIGTVLAVVAVAVLLWRGGTSGEKATTAPTTMAVPATAAPDPAAVAQAAVLDAYRKSFAEFVAVASDRNAGPDDPRLAGHTTGDALIASQAGILDLRVSGKVFTGDVETHPTVVELGGGLATVADCGVDRTATVELATGKVLSPPGSEGGAATAKLRVDAEGVWKVYDFKDERRPCVPPAS